jgi:hypothetical protein
MDFPKYCINPTFIWINENHNCIKVIKNQNDEPIYLNGTEAILWRSIWQGFPLVVWEQLAQEENTPILSTIQTWITLGMIVEETNQWLTSF